MPRYTVVCLLSPNCTKSEVKETPKCLRGDNDRVCIRRRLVSESVEAAAAEYEMTDLPGLASDIYLHLHSVR